MKPMNSIKRWKAAFCIFALLAIVTGCVQDDLSDCGIGVQFQYVKNVDNTDKFASLVDRITLFVFDDNGTYIGQYEDEGDVLKDNYVMNIPLKPGKYQLVAWGNLCEDYEVTPFVQGVTHMDEVMLSLKRTQNVVNEHPTHLFYGGIEEIELSTPYIGRRHVLMDMMKNTNSIHVTTRGLPLETATKSGSHSGTTFDCTITSINGDYKFDNSITGERLTYIPEYATEEQVLFSEFVIMRELNDRSTDSRIVITRHRGDDETETKAESDEPVELLNESLTDLLIPASITKDLDIDDDFTIEFVFNYTNGTVTIIINGWVIINENPVVLG